MNSPALLREGLELCRVARRDRRAHRLADADRRLRHAADTAQELESPHLEVLALCGFVELDVVRGRVAAAQQTLEHARSRMREAGPGTVGHVLVAAGRVRSASGDPTGAMQDFGAAVSEFHGRGAPEEAAEAAIGLVEASLDAAQPLQAVATLRSIDRQVPSPLRARLLLAEAEVERALGQLRSTRSLLEAAAALQTDDPTVQDRIAALDLLCASVLGQELPRREGGAALQLAEARVGLGACDLEMLHLTALGQGRRHLAIEVAVFAALRRADEHGDAASALAEARRDAERTGGARLRALVARAEASLEVWGGQPSSRTVRRLRSLLVRAKDAGDLLECVRLHLLLAQAVPALPRARAAAEARAAVRLAHLQGYAALGLQARGLLRLFDPSEPLGSDPLGDPLACAARLARAGDVPSAARYLDRLRDALVSAPAGRRPLLQRLVHAATRAGALRPTALGEGAALILDVDAGALWLGAEQVCKMRPSSLSWRLLVAIAKAGGSLDRQELYERVWEQRYLPPSSDNAMHVAVHRLRGKLPEGLAAIEPTEAGGFYFGHAPAVFCWRSDLTEATRDETVGPTGGFTLPELTSLCNVAPETTSFVGRKEAGQTLLVELAAGARLMSLVGAGGMGKTRLARRFALARPQPDAWPGGVWFVDASDVDDLHGLCRVVARTMGAQLTGKDVEAEVEQLAGTLAARARTLLVLDNVEQVVEAARPAVTRWLAEAEQLVVVATSRERLGLPQERVVELGPLPESEAVELFVQRARLVRPDYRPSTAERSTVGELVAALDRSPLAIELAAARMDVLSADGLIGKLGDRFALLRGAGREGNTGELASAVSWSWKLASEHEQRALAAFSMFRGGFSSADAEAVLDLSAPDAPWVFDLLRSLRGKSLLEVTERPEGGEPRFALLETVRAFAAERLGEVGDRDAAALAHARRMATAGEALAERLDGPDGLEALSAIGVDLENLLVAAERLSGSSDAGGRELSVRAALVAGEYLRLRGPQQTLRSLVDRAVPASRDCDPVLRARLGVLRGYGRVLFREGEVAEGLQEAFAGAREAGAERVAGEAAFVLGYDSLDRHDWDAVDRWFGEARGCFERAGDEVGVASVLERLGVAAHWRGRPTEAARLLEEAVATYEDRGCVLRLAAALGNLGNVERVLGRPSAEAGLEQGLELAQAAGNTRLAGRILGNLGNCSYDASRLDEAAERYEEAISLLEQAGDRPSLAVMVGNLGDVRRRQARWADARRHTLKARRIADGFTDRRNAGYSAGMLGFIYLEEGRLDDAREAIAAGIEALEGVGARTLQAHVRLARALLLRREGDLDGAEQELDALRSLYVEVEDTRSEAQCHAELASLEHLRGGIDRAAEGYRDALERARLAGDPSVEGRVRSRLAALTVDPTEAAAGFAAAKAHLDAAQDASGLGALQILQRGRAEPGEAERWGVEGWLAAALLDAAS